jgi:hypothetical protein
MYLKFQLIIATFFFSFIASAQNTSTISGQISDNMGVIEQVYVQLKELSLTSPTDVDGKFTFSNLKAGEYTLYISYLGYQTLEQKVSLKTGEVLNLKLLLNESITETDLITVVGKSRTQN